MELGESNVLVKIYLIMDGSEVHTATHLTKSHDSSMPR